MVKTLSIAHEEEHQKKYEQEGCKHNVCQCHPPTQEPCSLARVLEHESTRTGQVTHDTVASHGPLCQNQSSAAHKPSKCRALYPGMLTATHNT